MIERLTLLWSGFWYWLPVACLFLALAVIPFKLYDHFIARRPKRSKPDPDGRE